MFFSSLKTKTKGILTLTNPKPQKFPPAPPPPAPVLKFLDPPLNLILLDCQYMCSLRPTSECSYD